MLGIDIVDIEQIKGIYQKHGLLFLEKILDEMEISALALENNRKFFQNLSCLIASKEAIFKASSKKNLDWQDISIRNISKMPLIQIKNSNFKKRIILSLSVDGNIVLAQAIINKDIL